MEIEEARAWFPPSSDLSKMIAINCVVQENSGAEIHALKQLFSQEGADWQAAGQTMGILEAVHRMRGRRLRR